MSALFPNRPNDRLIYYTEEGERFTVTPWSNAHLVVEIYKLLRSNNLVSVTVDRFPAPVYLPLVGTSKTLMIEQLEKRGLVQIHDLRINTTNNESYMIEYKVRLTFLEEFWVQYDLAVL